MHKGLRILILEDIPAEAELTEHELRKAGIEFMSKHVDTREAFQAALLDFSPDIILSDYSLPSFDGLSAFAIAHERCPDVPFILVTGVLGEEFAIEALRKGVTDYVLKSNLARLVPVVHRALEEAQEREKLARAEDEIRQSRREWRNIFHAIGQPTIILDASHNVLLVNRATLNALGAKSEEEVQGKKCYELFHNTSEPPQQCPLEKMLALGSLETVEMEIEAFEGGYILFPVRLCWMSRESFRRLST